MAAIPFHSSVRIRLTGEGTALKNANGNVIGIKVPVKIIKNKVAPPFKNFDISIIFGQGIVEGEQLLEVLSEWFDKNEKLECQGNLIKFDAKGKMWKTLSVYDASTGEEKFVKKFTKGDFDVLRKDIAYASYFDDMIDAALCVKYTDTILAEDATLNPVSDEEETTTDE